MHGIGHNCGPADDENEDGVDFVSARIILRAVEYFQWNFSEPGSEELSEFLRKRKGGYALAARHFVSWALAGIVPQQALARFLHLNRKTAGEGAARPDKWAEADANAGDDRLQDQMQRVKMAVAGHATQDVAFIKERLRFYAVEDVNLRKIEDKSKAECEAAAKEAEVAAQGLEGARIKRLAALKKALKTHPRGAAIYAEQAGAAHAAKSMLSREGLGALAAVYDADFKGNRERESQYSAEGLKDCLRLELARVAEPHLSQATDRLIALTDFGRRVYAEALALDLVTKPKRSKVA